MTVPLVSVVVPTYGRPDDLKGAVATVGRQTYDRIELLVVDDCSPQPVEPAVRNTDLDQFERVQCLRHEENRGAAAARATGIDAATGQFVAFLDDDDRWVEHKLRTQVDAIQRAGSATGVAYTGMRIVNGDGETVRTQTPSAAGDLHRTLLCRNIVGSYSTVLVRQAAIDDVGAPDERFPSWQDLEWYVRLSRSWKFAVVPEPLTVVYQAEDHDQISDDFETIKSETYPLFVETFRPDAAGYGRLFERKMRAWAAFRVGAYNALRTGYVNDARRFLLRAVWLYPLEPVFWAYLGVAVGGDACYRLVKRLKREVDR